MSYGSCCLSVFLTCQPVVLCLCSAVCGIQVLVAATGINWHHPVILCQLVSANGIPQAQSLYSHSLPTLPVYMHCRDFMQVFSTLYLLQLPGDSWHEALAVSGWSGSLAADGMSSSPQPAASVHQAMPGATLAPAEGPPGHGAGQTLTGQHEGQQQQPRVQPQAPGKGQQHSQQQCLQVSPECLAWACRPQFKLVVGSACEVLLSLGQRDKHIITQVNCWHDEAVLTSTEAAPRLASAVDLEISVRPVCGSCLQLLPAGLQSPCNLLNQPVTACPSLSGPAW